jgi:heme/copper-type cytochrome/quinol oxidase subunit 4
METAQAQSGLGKYVGVYACMLLITALETFITYRHPSSTQLLVSSLLLAFIGAALGILFFMGLAAENRPLIVGFSIFTLFVLAALTYGWTDSFRILLGVPFAK